MEEIRPFLMGGDEDLTASGSRFSGLGVLRNQSKGEARPVPVAVVSTLREPEEVGGKIADGGGDIEADAEWVRVIAGIPPMISVASVLTGPISMFSQREFLGEAFCASDGVGLGDEFTTPRASRRSARRHSATTV